MFKLLENQTEDTDGSQPMTPWMSNPNIFHSTLGTIVVEGTFDGATVTIKGKVPGGALVSLGLDTVFTAAGFAEFSLSPGIILTAEVTDADTSTDISVTVV